MSLKFWILRSVLWLLGKDELGGRGWHGETSSELSGHLAEKWGRKERVELGVTYLVTFGGWGVGRG